MKATFNQLCAAGIVTISLFGLLFVYFIPTKVDHDTKITALGALGMALNAGIIFLLKASSDASHKEQNDKMIDALANSAPAKVQ